jgi:hypothetical protein
MSTTPPSTPGQTAYEAYVQHFQAYPAHTKSTIFPGPWVFRSPLEHECWEAAAQAVLAWQQETPHA